MKAEELRIGNYLDGRIGFVVVEEIRKDGCMVKIEGSRSSFIVGGEAPCLTPIPLTEEWFFNFGFKVLHQQTMYIKGGHVLEVNNNDTVKFYTGDYGGWFVNIRHVHTLQNLYFALTGEELTLNETI